MYKRAIKITEAYSARSIQGACTHTLLGIIHQACREVNHEELMI